jgi:hypothetical protein
MPSARFHLRQRPYLPLLRLCAASFVLARVTAPVFFSMGRPLVPRPALAAAAEDGERRQSDWPARYWVLPFGKIVDKLGHMAGEADGNAHAGQCRGETF